MLCQHCNQNQATVCLHLNINGREQSLRLCPQCASELESQYFGPMRTLLWPFGGLPGQAAPAHVRTPTARPEISGELDPDLSRRRELSALKTRLEAAVQGENYEEAVRLRDQIKGLDGPL